MPKMIIHSDYLKGKENVFDDELVRFLNEGQQVPSQNNPEEMKWMFWVMLPNGKKKKCTPNNKSLQILKDAWGEMTEDWVGQDARVKISYENVYGTMRNVIYLEPAEGIITPTPKAPKVQQPLSNTPKDEATVNEEPAFGADGNPTP